MSILSDREIIELSKNHGMISPFEEKQVKVHERNEKIGNLKKFHQVDKNS